MQKKLSTPPFAVSDSPVPVARILTAAESQCDYMLTVIPEHAKVLVIAGGEQSWRGDLRTRAGAAGEALVSTWEIRTALGETEAKAWAACQAICGPHGAKTVWVCFFTDGEVGGWDAVGCHKAEAFEDWSFALIKIAAFLLSHGAQLVYTADDAYNPSVDPRHPGLVSFGIEDVSCCCC